jgi:hypothetical protein
MIHHCIGPNPEHGVYRGMSEPIRAASTFLSDPSVAPDEIDVFPCIQGLELTVESHHDLCSKIETGIYFPTFGYGIGAC